MPQHSPRSRSFVNALVDHFSNNRDRLAVQEFKWVAEDVGHFNGDPVGLSEPTHKKLVTLAANLMPDSTPDHFLDRLLEFYSQKEKFHVLREVLRNRVVDDFYKKQIGLIALDLPSALLPKKYQSKMSEQVILDTTRLMTQELTGKNVNLEELLIGTQEEIMKEMAPAYGHYRFVVLQVSAEFKELLQETISPPTEFSARVVAYFIKTLKSPPQGKA